MSTPVMVTVQHSPSFTRLPSAVSGRLSVRGSRDPRPGRRCRAAHGPASVPIVRRSADKLEPCNRTEILTLFGSPRSDRTSGDKLMLSTNPVITGVQSIILKYFGYLDSESCIFFIPVSVTCQHPEKNGTGNHQYTVK